MYVCDISYFPRDGDSEKLGCFCISSEACGGPPSEEGEISLKQSADETPSIIIELF